MNGPVFVFGAGGFVGTHLLNALARAGASVVAASRRASAVPENTRAVVGELHRPDDFTPLLERCRTVVHLASTSTPASTAGDPLIELHSNLQPTLGLLRALRERPDVHLVYVSSGGNLYRSDTEASERMPPAARSYHGAGKAAAEQFIHAWCAQSGGRATILRPSNVYGPGQERRAGFAIVPTAMHCALTGEPLTIWGDGSAVRDYLYIDDFIALCMAAIGDQATAGCTTYNASAGCPIRLDALLAEIEQVSGRRIRRTNEPSRRVDQTFVSIDHAAATRRYGWKPSVALRDGLALTWAWMSSRP